MQYKYLLEARILSKLVVEFFNVKPTSNLSNREEVLPLDVQHGPTNQQTLFLEWGGKCFAHKMHLSGHITKKF